MNWQLKSSTQVSGHHSLTYMYIINFLESCNLDSNTCEKNAVQNNPFMSLENISTSWNNGSNMVLSNVSCELNKVLVVYCRGQISCVHNLLMIIVRNPPNPAKLVMHTRIHRPLQTPV